MGKKKNSSPPRRSLRKLKSAVREKNTNSLVAQLVKTNDAPDIAPAKPKKLPSPPADVLDKVGLAEWHRVTTLLLSINVVTELDTTALLLYCDAYSDFVRAVDELNKTKRDIIKTGEQRGGQYRNPWYDVKKKAAQEMNQYMALLGLSPHDRAKMSSVRGKSPTAKPNEFDEF